MPANTSALSQIQQWLESNKAELTALVRIATLIAFATAALDYAQDGFGD